jgi:hypothetical protein
VQRNQNYKEPDDDGVKVDGPLGAIAASILAIDVKRSKDGELTP